MELFAGSTRIWGNPPGPPVNDPTPPTQPGTPTAANLTATTATLSWAASTDTGGSGLAGYDLYRVVGAPPPDPLLAQSATSTTTLTGLTPSTVYQIYVRARDGSGNLSAASNIVTFTTPPGNPAGACRVGYVANDWGPGSNGFTANITITNTSTTTVASGWILAFTYSAGQRSGAGWNATFSQPAGSGNVTATGSNPIAPSGSTTLGFNGTFTGSNPAPTGFTLNGQPCTV
jgi:hypothetical protein